MTEDWSIAGVVAAAACALAYGAVWCHRDDPGPVGAAVKAASTGLLALVLLLAAGAGGGWFWLMPLGLALGAAGDLFLALRGPRLFLAGMAAFGLGHLAYAAGLVLRSAEIGFDGLSAGEAAALAVLVALCFRPRSGLRRARGRCGSRCAPMSG